MKAKIIINAGSGTVMSLGATETLNQIRQALGRDCDVCLVQPAQLKSTLEDAFNDTDTAPVIVAGGDGTVSLAGTLALQTGRTMGVIPLGTFNLFARSISMPLGFAEALSALAKAKVAKVDTGEVDGSPFLNHVSLGLHPRVVRLRDQLPRAGQWSKIWNGTKSLFRMAWRTRSRKVSISGDFPSFEMRASIGLIAINPVPATSGPLPVRPGQSHGKLGCYFSGTTSPIELASLASQIIVGNWENAEHMRSMQSSHISIDLGRRTHMSVDGEIRLTEPIITCRIRPKSLSVLIPATQ